MFQAQQSRNFFVLGLPRSRTAWLANFLTYENRHCFHEGFNDCKSIGEYNQKLGKDKGDSSTQLMLIDIEKEYPDAPKLIIESDGKKAAKFIKKEFGRDCTEVIEFFKLKLDRIKGMRIHFEDIDNSLEDIWNHLIRTKFNKERAALLKGLNVQMKDTHIITQAGKDLWNSK